MRALVTIVVVLAAIVGAVAIGYQLRLRGPAPATAPIPKAVPSSVVTAVAAHQDQRSTAVPTEHRFDKPARPTWKLLDERDFTTAGAIAQSPWYDSDVHAATTGSAFDSSGQYQPFTALVVPASRDRERACALSARMPHAVRWELGILDPSQNDQGQFSGYQNKTIAFDEEGLSIAAAAADAAMPMGENRVVLERFGGRLTCSLNGVEVAVFAVAEDDRQPLRVGATGYAVAITSSRIYLAGDEQPSDSAPAGPVAPASAPLWRASLRESFDEAESIGRVAVWGDGGDVQWWQPKQALLLGTTPQHSEAYAAIHGSFPGDIRVSFRALRAQSASEVSIGIFFSCDGIAGMDGYFAEWGRGGAQVKKRAHIKQHVAAPTPATPDRWVRCELTSVGGAITMKLEEQTVLSWTDPHPLQGSRHDLACFYVWADNTLIDDLLIERNGNDPIKPLPDDPALPDRIGDGRPKAAAPDGHENF